MAYLKRGAVVAWQWMLLVDRSLLLWVRQWEKRWVTRWMKMATRLGDPSSWVAYGVLLFAIGEPVRLLTSLLAWSALAGAGAAQMFKHACRRQRPRISIENFNALVQEPDPYSFPSGHTATAFAVAIALLPVHPMLGMLALFHACNVAVSRVYLGAHYPLDVAAGALLGSGVGLGVYSLLA